MSKVSMWVTLTLKEGMRDEAVAIIQEALDNVQAEPGTLVYTLNTDDSNPNVVHFYEAYADQAALAVVDDLHRAAAEYEARTDEDGITDVVGDPPRALGFGELGGQDARQCIGRTSGREWHHPLYRARGIVLRRGRDSTDDHSQHCQYGPAPAHFALLVRHEVDIRDGDRNASR